MEYTNLRQVVFPCKVSEMGKNRDPISDGWSRHHELLHGGSWREHATTACLPGRWRWIDRWNSYSAGWGTVLSSLVHRPSSLVVASLHACIQVCRISRPFFSFPQEYCHNLDCLSISSCLTRQKKMMMTRLTLERKWHKGNGGKEMEGK
jgi:hypothetical protein